MNRLLRWLGNRKSKSSVENCEDVNDERTQMVLAAAVKMTKGQLRRSEISLREYRRRMVHYFVRGYKRQAKKD